MSQRFLVITGASKGIGRATASRFLAEGYEVINLSRTDPSLEGVNHWPIDLADSSEVAALQPRFEQDLSSASQIVLVHNAGLLLKDSTQTVELNDWQRVFQVNVIAASQLNRMLIPLMPKTSSILYVGSTLSAKAVANSCSYVTSKHAQLGLMRSSCQDLAGTGIHTASICPGFTETEMLISHVGGSQDVLDSIASGNAMNRLIDPDEIAKTIGFAANNPVINGAEIHANLGQLET